MTFLDVYICLSPITIPLLIYLTIWHEGSFIILCSLFLSRSVVYRYSLQSIPGWLLIWKNIIFMFWEFLSTFIQRQNALFKHDYLFQHKISKGVNCIWHKCENERQIQPCFAQWFLFKFVTTTTLPTVLILYRKQSWIIAVWMLHKNAKQ